MDQKKKKQFLNREIPRDFIIFLSFFLSFFFPFFNIMSITLERKLQNHSKLKIHNEKLYRSIRKFIQWTSSHEISKT